MSQLTITISDKADALIAQLQKEIFNRRRKKVTAEGVVATLLESGAKSQSDKRFATSWQNLIADIERAAKVAQAHGSKPSNLSDEEWALVLSHRTRSTKAPASTPTRKARPAARAKAAAPAAARRRSATASATSAVEEAHEPSITAPKGRTSRASAKAKPVSKPKPKAKASTGVKAKATSSSRSSRSRSAKAPASATSAKTPAAKAPSRKAASPSPRSARSSVAKRMAKAASRLVSTPLATPAPLVSTPPASPSNGTSSLDPVMS